MTIRRTLGGACVAVAASLAFVLAAGAGATGTTPRRATAAKLSPQTALQWNLIAVNTVRAATPAKFQTE